jgi:hypothetical protein
MKARAKQQAFYKGKRLRPGDSFEFKGKDKDLPKWAVPGGVAVKPKPAPGGTDSKSIETQQAIKAKTDPANLV